MTDRMDDLISRTEAIRIASGYCHPANIADELRKLPPAQPEQRWIPCSERLPNDESYVLVYYILNEYIDEKMDIWIGWHEMDGIWYVDGEEHDEEWNNEVIAWMPLPEPYNANHV